jgi:acyl carrier protein
MSAFEGEIKELIVGALGLEDIQPDAIDSDEALFGDGLGLDSIDALEIGVALQKRYGITIGSATEEVKAHFQSVRTIARFVESLLEERARSAG